MLKFIFSPKLRLVFGLKLKLIFGLILKLIFGLIRNFIFGLMLKFIYMNLANVVSNLITFFISLNRFSFIMTLESIGIV